MKPTLLVLAIAMALSIAIPPATASAARPERPDSTPRNEYEAPPTAEQWDGTVDYWRPLVERFFSVSDIDWALAIISCESSGNPSAKNPDSSASGLFQHLARYWPERSTKAGWAGSDIFDPEANIAVGAWLLKTGGKSHWVCTA